MFKGIPSGFPGCRVVGGVSNGHVAVVTKCLVALLGNKVLGGIPSGFPGCRVHDGWILKKFPFF